jgi:hypothetical protein
MLDNKTSKHMFKPDKDAIKEFLVKHQNEAIEQMLPPFPSLYGKFDV